MTKIKNFTDLNAWKEARKLVFEVYKITNGFPSKEMYALTSQMRRAVVSVSSNVAEGFSRRTRKEKVQFYFTALGSLTELQSQIILASDVEYIRLEEYRKLLKQTTPVQKLINGLIKGVEKIHNT